MAWFGVAIAAAGLAVASSALAQITIPTVPIGYPGNTPDPATENLYGSVSYLYNIGATEVTNAQYTAFLNAVASTDTNGLYSQGMASSSSALGGIDRTGVPGGYSYSTVPGRANHPVNFVTFWDAARFANWLHNGQPTGPQSNATTEDGAYTLTPGGISANTITRNAGWRWAVASKNEWHKAAFHQPANTGGDSDNYWFYPISSNTAPTTAQANYGDVIGNTTAVGSYTANFYGALDMAGNVWEWNDLNSGPNRGYLGGSYTDGVGTQRADNQQLLTATFDNENVGFRVTQISSVMCAADFNGVGGLTVQDIFEFLASYFAGEFRADFNGSMSITVQDIFDFLAAYFAGC